jgi:1-acyl-sn-glycerol-3-phosphate acyltransferase
MAGGRARDMVAPGPTMAGGGADDVTAAVARALERTRGAAPADLSPSTRIADLDLDSLALVGLALELEDAVGVPIEVDEIAGAETLDGLAQLIAERRNSPHVEKEPSNWPFSAPARAVRAALGVVLVRPVLRLIARPRVEGAEHLAQLPGPVLLCGNHASHLDAPLVEAALPGRMRRHTAVAAAADYFFDRTRLLGALTALLFAAFPFGRHGSVRASLERVASRLDQGWNVILFPEGTRSVSGEIRPFLDGIGLLATDFGARVVPCCIEGAHALLPKGRARPRRGRVTVRFGPLVEIPAGASIADATRAVEAAVRALQPERRAQ